MISGTLVLLSSVNFGGGVYNFFSLVKTKQKSYTN